MAEVMAEVVGSDTPDTEKRPATDDAVCMLVE